MYDRYVCREKSVARSRPRRCSATFSTVIACDAWRARCWAAAFSSPRTDSIRSRHSSARDLSRHVLDLLRPSWSYQTTLYEVLVGRARVSMLAMPSVYASEGMNTRSEGMWPGIMPTFPHDSGPPAGVAVGFELSTQPVPGRRPFVAIVRKGGTACPCHRAHVSHARTLDVRICIP